MTTSLILMEIRRRVQDLEERAGEYNDFQHGINYAVEQVLSILEDFDDRSHNFGQLDAHVRAYYDNIAF